MQDLLIIKKRFFLPVWFVSEEFIFPEVVCEELEVYVNVVLLGTVAIFLNSSFPLPVRISKYIAVPADNPCGVAVVTVTVLPL